MREEVFFMPLGGGQRVGASCYYLRLGNINIILDAGTCNINGAVSLPDLHSLVTSPFIQSINQINQVFISHAHYDHIGCLLKLMRKAAMAGVYMTKATKLLSEYQLYDRTFLYGKCHNENESLEAQYIFDRISLVSFMQKIDFGSYKASFWPAGHIPGAMMVLFEYGSRKILYTGDYSLKSTPLTDGCIIPGNMDIDTVIMCGLHAKHPGYIKKQDRLFITVQYVLNIAKHKTIICHVPQLSKGIEFIKILNIYNKHNIPIYIGKSVMDVIAKMEKLSIPILNANNKVFDGLHGEDGQFIYVTADKNCKLDSFYEEINIDFSLHEDFKEMKEFIRRINPKHVIAVHCAKENPPYSETIEQSMMMEGDCQTQFIFAEEKEIYKI